MSIKLLVADDSITIQKVIGIIFGGEEYSLTVVDNGKTAIEKAREICPDVLLIDALMPGMNGYEVAEAIRSTPALSSKPILILTGSFEPFDEDKARKCGADDFLAKPFESQQIINKVKELSELGFARDKTAVPPPPTAVPAPSFAPEAIPAIDPFTSFTEQGSLQETAIPAPETSTDIWNAFSFDPETVEPAPVIAAAAVGTMAAASSILPADEPDVFSIVTEEYESSIIQPSTANKPLEQNIGSQWVPVEENTFEFEEEKAEEFTAPVTKAQPEPAPPSSFGDISFEDDETDTTAAVTAFVASPSIQTTADAFQAQPEAAAAFTFDESPVVTPPLTESLPETARTEIPAELPQAAETFSHETLLQPAIPAAAPAPLALTEEQLKAALSAASKEVIERIVWEVVPDLAEALIKDAIRKIKEGI